MRGCAYPNTHNYLRKKKKATLLLLFSPGSDSKPPIPGRVWGWEVTFLFVLRRLVDGADGDGDGDTGSMS